MSASVNIQYIGYYRVGDAFCITVPNVHNICSKLVADVELAITIPAGVTLDSYTIPKGSFDSMTNIWTVGALTPNQLAEASFCFEITDDCLQPYDFVFTVSAPAECGDCFNQPEYCVQWHGISCCQLSECFPDGETNLNIYNSNGTVTDAIRSVNLDGNSLFWNNADIFTLNGVGGDFFRFVDGTSFQIDMTVAASPINIEAGGNALLSAGGFAGVGNLTLEAADSLLLDSDAQDYRFVTAPADNDTMTKILMRNAADGVVYLRDVTSLTSVSTLSWGDYADDTAAGVGGVPVGGHYFNTTNVKMHTRMT